MFARMLRFDRFKYVRSEIEDQTFEILFNLKADPDETTNVFEQPGYEAVSTQARKRLDEWLVREEIGMTYEV
jgi:hypothetical protein